MESFHLLTHTLMLKPIQDEIYSERATRIRLNDEVGGLFLEIVQEYTSNQPQNENLIQITKEEWPHLQEAITRQFAEIERMEALGYGAPQ